MCRKRKPTVAGAATRPLSADAAGVIVGSTSMSTTGRPCVQPGQPCATQELPHPCPQASCHGGACAHAECGHGACALWACGHGACALWACGHGECPSAWSGCNGGRDSLASGFSYCEVLRRRLLCEGSSPVMDAVAIDMSSRCLNTTTCTKRRLVCCGWPFFCRTANRARLTSST